MLVFLPINREGSFNLHPAGRFKSEAWVVHPPAGASVEARQETLRLAERLAAMGAALLRLPITAGNPAASIPKLAGGWLTVYRRRTGCRSRCRLTRGKAAPLTQTELRTSKVRGSARSAINLELSEERQTREVQTRRMRNFKNA